MEERTTARIAGRRACTEVHFRAPPHGPVTTSLQQLTVNSHVAREVNSQTVQKSVNRQTLPSVQYVRMLVKLVIAGGRRRSLLTTYFRERGPTEYLSAS
ncbi:hypothetical protein LZ554_006780 [Drepanopeziza brunnea f. sp. 'monogermtubi']|nr:hypothetical protein LZ554_006780 [Drepanopeziza brunnea f. sp. 'monogermtubi']